MMNGTGSAMETFGQSVSNLTREFGIQGGQIKTLEGLYFTLSAGIRDTDSAMKTMEAAAKVATVGITDMQTSVDILTTVMNSYNVSASNAEQVSSGLFAIVRQGKMVFEDLAQSFGPLVAIANQANVEWREAGAALAELTAQGFSTRRAATAVRATFNQMLRPTEAMQKVFEELAVEMDLLSSRGRKLKNRMDNLKQSQKRMKQEVSANKEALDAIRNGASDVGDIMGTTTGKIKKLNSQWVEQQAELRSAQQEYQEIRAEISGLEARMDGFSDSMRDNRIKMMEIRLQADKQGRELTQSEKERIEELQTANDELRLNQLKTEKKIEKAKEKQAAKAEEVKSREKKANQTRQQLMTALQDKNEKLTQSLNDLSEELSTVEDHWANYIDTIGPALIKQEGLATTLTKMRDKAEEMGIPIQSLFTNIRALSGVMPLLSDNMKGFRDSLASIRDPQENINSLFERFSSQFGMKFREVINSIREVIELVGMDLSNSLIPIMESWGDQLGSLIETYRSMDEELRSSIATFAVLTTTVAAIVGPIMIFSGQIMMLISAGLPTLVTLLTGALIAFGGFGSSLREVMSSTSRANTEVDNLGNKLAGAGEKAKTAKNPLKDFQETVQGLIQKIRDFVGLIRSQVIPSFLDFADGMRATTNAFVSGMSEITKETDKFGGSVKSLMSRVGDMLSDLGEWMKEQKALSKELGKFAGVMINQVVPITINLIKIMLMAAEIVGSVISTFMNIPGVIPAIKGLAAAVGVVLVGLRKVTGAVVSFMSRFMPVIKAVASAAGFYIGLHTALMLASGGLVKYATIALAGAGNTFTLSGALATAQGGLMSLLPSIIANSTALTALSTAAKAAWSSLLGPIGLVLAAVSLLAVAWTQNLFGIRDKTHQAISFVKGKFNSMVKTTKKFFNKHKMWFSLLGGIILLLINPFTILLIAWKNNWLNIQGITKNAVKKIVGFFDWLGGAIKKGMKSIGRFIGKTWDAALNKLKNLARKGFNKVVDLIKGYVPEFESVGEAVAWGLRHTIIGILFKMFPSLEEWTANFVDTVVKGILKKIPEIGDSIKKVAQVIEDYIGVFSDTKKGPMSDLTSWGPNVSKTYAKGIKSNEEEVNSAMLDMAEPPEEVKTGTKIPTKTKVKPPEDGKKKTSDQTQSIIEDLKKLKENFSSVMEEFGTVTEEIANRIEEELAPMIQKVNDRLKGSSPEFVKNADVWGKKTIQNFVSGVQAALPEAKRMLRKIGQSANVVLDPLNNAFDKWKKSIASTVDDMVKSLKVWKKAVKTLKNVDGWVEKHITKPFTKLVDNALSWGEKFISDFAQGMMNKKGEMKTAVKTITGIVADRMATNPDAKKGPLSKVSKWGENLVSTFAADIKSGQQAVNNAVKGMGTTPAMPKKAPKTGGGDNITKLIVKEGAFKILPGAFEGVSEEELPEAVRKEAEVMLTEEILERLEGRGQTEP